MKNGLKVVLVAVLLCGLVGGYALINRLYQRDFTMTSENVTLFHDFFGWHCSPSGPESGQCQIIENERMIVLDDSGLQQDWELQAYLADGTNCNQMNVACLVRGGMIVDVTNNH